MLSNGPDRARRNAASSMSKVSARGWQVGLDLVQAKLQLVATHGHTT